MLDLIAQRKAELGPAERRVADWVLEHPRRAARMRLAELATASGSSEPTVIRFCRRFGLRGFRDFAPRMTEALSRPAAYVHHDVLPDDAPVDAATKVVDASIQALLAIRSQVASMPVQDVVNALAAARQIVFAGLGASGHVAADASHKFFRLGLPCTALTDSPSILQYAAIAEPGDVLLVTSHSGRWSELARATATAGERGACTVALTEPGTPLAGAARFLLPCHATEDTNVYTPMSSRLAQLALLDALQVALALALGDAAVDRLRRSKDALKSL